MKKLFLILFLFSNIGFLQAQQNTGTIRGAIHDSSNGESVMFAKVIVLTPDSVLLGGAYTDVDGLFNITHLPPGQYTIQVIELEHELKIVSGVICKPNEITTLTIEMKQPEKKLIPVLIECGIHCGGPKVIRKEHE